jgi:hypothetical protein
VGRTVNLVKFIIESRPILLRNHRIDQIIVCAIASLISINRSRSTFTLEEVFSHYNQLILSYYANRHSLYDHDGNQLGLIDFYNAVFLPSVEDIINNEEHAAILATPVRLERRRSRELGIEMTPIPKKFKQAPSLLVPTRKIVHNDLSVSASRARGQDAGNTGSYRSAYQTLYLAWPSRSRTWTVSQSRRTSRTSRVRPSASTLRVTTTAVSVSPTSPKSDRFNHRPHFCYDPYIPNDHNLNGLPADDGEVPVGGEPRAEGPPQADE